MIRHIFFFVLLAAASVFFGLWVDNYMAMGFLFCFMWFVNASGTFNSSR